MKIVDLPLDSTKHWICDICLVLPKPYNMDCW
jgi:hypothetical protein